MNSHTSIQKILLIGGTFCPPHQAHVGLAKSAQEQYQFDHVIFIPCSSPVLDKEAHASVEHRLAMLRLALKPFHDFSIDLCEINRDTPSYMVTTLAYFRQRYGAQASLTLLIGMDNFLQLPRWHQWESILTYSHLLVAERPHVQPVFNAVLKKLLHEHQASDTHDLGNSPYGTITQMNAGQYDLSSTEIRAIIKQKIQSGCNTDQMIAPEVRQYIQAHHLF